MGKEGVCHHAPMSQSQFSDRASTSLGDERTGGDVPPDHPGSAAPLGLCRAARTAHTHSSQPSPGHSSGWHGVNAGCLITGKCMKLASRLLSLPARPAQLSFLSDAPNMTGLTQLRLCRTPCDSPCPYCLHDSSVSTHCPAGPPAAKGRADPRVCTHISSFFNTSCKPNRPWLLQTPPPGQPNPA